MTVREYKRDLATGGKLYARLAEDGAWTCEIRGAATWCAAQKSPEPVWVSCRKWDKLPEVFGIDPEVWNEFRQGVQSQEEEAEAVEEAKDGDGITPEIEAKAVEILKSGKPVEFFLDTFGKIHVGDRDLGQILIYCTGSQLNKTSNGLHPKLSGESGMGKSDAVETFLHCLPKCAYIKTSLSSKSIFYHDIRPGTLIFLDDYKQNDDLDAIIKQTSSRFHDPYEHRTIDKDRQAQVMIAPPEIVWAITSVDTSQDIQVLNRQVGLDVDATEDTTRAVIDHLLAQAVEGAERFPLTEEVLICRAMVLELKKHSFRVAIPYAKRMRWKDLSSRRNPSIFLDLIRSNAVWHFMQRPSTDEDFIQATEEDFVAAKTLYVGRADTLIDKLSKPERKLAEAILANRGEMYRDEAAAALKVSVNRISQLVHGENGRTGLIQKLPGFNAEKVTLRDEVRSVQKVLLTMVGYNRFQGFDSIVTLEPEKKTLEGNKYPVSEELTDKTGSSNTHSKIISKIDSIYERDLLPSTQSKTNIFSIENSKTPYSPYTDIGSLENRLTSEFMAPDSQKKNIKTLQKDESNITNEEISITQENEARERKFATPISGHHYAPDGRDLDEEGEWEDCDNCGLPLPPSWQKADGSEILCSSCANRAKI
jgi:plasmid maintenance system antidote protein VapI